MNTLRIRQYSSRITAQRSLVPDIKMILTAALFSVTIIGLPIAFGIIREYYAYLYKAIKYYKPESGEKKKLYKYKSPSEIMFDYNIKSFAGALKAIAYVFLPGTCFIKKDRLSEDRYFDLKVALMSLKTMFFDVFIAFGTVITLIVLIFFASSWYRLLCIAGIVLVPVIFFKPFVVYCQALTVFGNMLENEKSNSVITDDDM